ncbi:MAG: YiiD C-terminal domain-containing protein [Gammaproteobacteria bacterium]
MPTDPSSLDWPRHLGNLWTAGIPLAGAMGVEIRRLDEHLLEIAAPLAPNRNHMGTAFGGSLQGLATLAGWGATLIATGDPDTHHVVIRDAQMRFLAPVSGELVATAVRPSPGAVAAFHGTLAERGRARLTVPVTIQGPGDTVAARFVGEFVAFGSDSAATRPVPTSPSAPA